MSTKKLSQGLLCAKWTDMLLLDQFFTRQNVIGRISIKSVISYFGKERILQHWRSRHEHRKLLQMYPSLKDQDKMVDEAEYKFDKRHNVWISKSQLKTFYFYRLQLRHYLDTSLTWFEYSKFECPVERKSWLSFFRHSTLSGNKTLI